MEAQLSAHAGGRTVFLSDGTRALVRPIGPDDAEALAALHKRLSSESRYLRYFSFGSGLPERLLARFTHADGRLHAGVVAFVDGRLVGHACFDRAANEREAEVGFEVDDALHGRGLGTLLLEALVRAGQGAGVAVFLARVLPQNRVCLEVFRDLGLEETTRYQDGSVLVRIDLTPTESSRAAAARRHARARCAHARGGEPDAPTATGDEACTSSSSTESSTQ